MSDLVAFLPDAEFGGLSASSLLYVMSSRQRKAEAESYTFQNFEDSRDEKLHQSVGLYCLEACQASPAFGFVKRKNGTANSD